MRARLRTLGLLAALATPCPPTARAQEPTRSPSPAQVREVRPEGPLARGLLPVPGWALGVAFAGVVLVSVLGLVQLRRSAGR